MSRAKSPEVMRRPGEKQKPRRSMLSPELRIGSPPLARMGSGVSTPNGANGVSPYSAAVQQPVSRFYDVASRTNGPYSMVRARNLLLHYVMRHLFLAYNCRLGPRG